MNYEQRLKEGYKSHVAALHPVELPDGIRSQYLRWGKPGTSERCVTYLTVGASLIVRGDYGAAVYQVTAQADLAWWADTDLGYFQDKCVASPRGCGHMWHDWSEGECCRRLNEFAIDHFISDPELLQECREAAGSEESFHAWLDQHGEELLGDWWLDYQPHKWGNVPAFYLRAHHIGLQMAMKQLENAIDREKVG